jgi:hypothetical protein
MVCMGLRMSPRIPIQKTDLRDFFRRTNPATRKSSPNPLGAYMRRAGEPHGKPTQLNYTCLGGCSEHSHSFSGYFAWFSCLRVRLLGGDCLKFGLRPRYLTSKPCFPRSGTLCLLWWACLLGARRLLFAWAVLVAFGLPQRACEGNWSPAGLLISGHHLGSVDRWLCQTFHQIFGDGSVKYPRLRVDLARVLSSWGAYVTV